MSLRPAVEPESVLDNRQRTRYSRQILLHGEDGQARLAAARVLVVGAGGLGSPALMYLAAAGVGTIGIVDDDVVGLSNLHRQVIHEFASVATPKAVSAAVKIEGLNPDVDAIVYAERLTEENAVELMSGYDVVLDGSDNFLTRYVVDAACSELSIPEVWGSILRHSAQVSVFWTGERARRFGVEGPGVCLRDLFPSPPPAGTTPNRAEAGVLGSLCGQVGSVMAGEAVKLITGVGEPLLGTVLVLDALSNRYETIALVGRPDRPKPLKGERLMNARSVPSPPEANLPKPTAAGANTTGLNAAGPSTAGSGAFRSGLSKFGMHGPGDSGFDVSETLIPGASVLKARNSEFDASETLVPGTGGLEFDVSETLVPGADGLEFDASETLVPGASEPEFDPSETLVPGSSVSGLNASGWNLPKFSGAAGSHESDVDVSETLVPGVGGLESDVSETLVPNRVGSDLASSEARISEPGAPGSNAHAWSLSKPRAGESGQSELDASETLVPRTGSTRAFAFNANAPGTQEAQSPEQASVTKVGASESGAVELSAVESGAQEDRMSDSRTIESIMSQGGIQKPSVSGSNAPGRMPEQDAGVPEPDADMSERNASTSEPDADVSERNASTSEPDASTSEPDKSEAAALETEAGALDTNAAQSAPGAAQTASNTVQTGPRAAQPKPTEAQSTPNVTPPKPDAAPGADEIDVPEANVREVAVRLAQGARMLDVRESRERAICAIRPSTHIPLADVLADPSAAAQRLPDGPVYVYCLGGVRSMQAAKALAAEGVEVINVAGGLKQWWLYVDPSMPRY